jgi:dipeptidyl aminopeptidase/acylaminoacyl peptidase
VIRARVFVTCASASLAWIAQSAWAQRVPTPTDMIGMPTYQGPRISHDGERVVVQVQRADWSTKGFVTSLDVIPAAGGPALHLPHGSGSESDPAWSPDDRVVAFLSDRPGGPQVFAVRPGDSSVVQITRVPAGVQSFQWPLDGRSVIALGGADGAAHVYRVPLGADSVGQAGQDLLAGSSLNVGAFAISPDGGRVAFTASDASGNSLRVLTLAGGAIVTLIASPDVIKNPMWSVDGTRIAFDRFPVGAPLYANAVLTVIAAGGGPARAYPGATDETPTLVAWDSTGILFEALHRTGAHLYRFDPSTGRTERLTGPEVSLQTDFSFSRDGRTVAYLALVDSWLAVAVARVGGAPRIVSTSPPIMDSLSFARREVITWHARDGTAIDGIIIRPRPGPTQRRAPLAVILHGGPAGADWPSAQTDYIFPIEQLSARGIVVLKVNYRGSLGYGSRFRALNVGHVGAAELGDVLSGIASLARSGAIDSTRVAVLGWSYGGFLAAYGAATTSRFTAAVVGAGVTDWVADYSATVFPDLALDYLRGTPWADPTAYNRASPIRYRSNTPTLILHCRTDPVVPLINARELDRQLRDRRVPERLQVFDGCGHFIGSPTTRRDASEEILRWLETYLLGAHG